MSGLSTKMKISSLLASLIICTSFVLSQQSGMYDKDRFLQLMQSGYLSRMTAEQIRQRIKDAGMTEEDAIRLARERNFDLERYLRTETGAKATLGKSTEMAKQPVAEMVSPAMRPPSRLKEELIIPEFVGRADSTLQPFGYSIFDRAPTAFEPIVNVPTPQTYTLGPGDEIVLNVWGETQLAYTLTVARDGYIVIPDVGKVQVAGVTVQALKRVLLDRMSTVYASLAHGGARATSFLDVSIGQLRTIQVFVLGEARFPGGYNLSGLATALTALYYAGGPDINGTLRDIKVIRDNKVIASVDFYEFVLTGKREQDVRLQEGDVVSIGRARTRAAITGKVSRPAIYELKSDETVSDLIRMAGDLRSDAYIKRIHVERIVPFSQRAKFQKDILDIDYTFSSYDELMNCRERLEGGDVVTVFGINKERENVVKVSGNVWKPGSYELSPDMTVKDLIYRADGLREDTFFERGTIIRTRQTDLRKEIVPFNLRLAVEGDPLQNVKLQRLDSVIVYHDSVFHPRHPVAIDGAVRNPGVYTRAEGTTVADLIILAGGLLDGADVSQIEVARLDTTKKEKIAEVFKVNLPREFWKSGNPHDFVLRDYDRVSVRMKPEFVQPKVVVVSGEALYPGVYTLREEGEKLHELIKRFGGFKPTAYLPGVRLVRSPGQGGIPARNPLVAEQENLDSLGRPLPVYVRLASSDVPIDIERVMDNPNSVDNVALQPGDSLVVPRDPGVVYVQGQVNTPSSVPFKEGAGLKYYVQQAGGYTQNADKGNTVVILPNGKKWEPSGFFLLPDPEVLSGSTVVVPTELPRESKTLPVLREITGITLSAVTMAYIVWQVTK
jgi:protein involved in polysaccharide export with SLBB domain